MASTVRTITRSLDKVRCPLCGTEAYLVVRVRSTGKFYVSIQHRDAQGKMITHYIKAEELEEKLGKDLAEKVRNEVNKILEELKAKEHFKIDLEKTLKKVIRFLADNVKTLDDLEKYLTILKALIDVENSYEECMALFNKGYNNLSDDEKKKWEECIDYDYDNRGWSYKALAVKASPSVSGPVIVKLESAGIITQTYRSRRSKYWRLAVDKQVLSIVLNKIHQILRKEGILGLMKLFNKYDKRIPASSVKSLINDVLKMHIGEAVMVNTILLTELISCNEDKDVKFDVKFKVLEYLIKLTDELSLDISKIEDNRVKDLLVRVLNRLKAVINCPIDNPRRRKIIEFKDAGLIVRITDAEYARLLNTVFNVTLKTLKRECPRLFNLIVKEAVEKLEEILEEKKLPIELSEQESYQDSTIQDLTISSEGDHTIPSKEQ